MQAGGRAVGIGKLEAVEADAVVAPGDFCAQGFGQFVNGVGAGAVFEFDEIFVGDALILLFRGHDLGGR